MPTEGLPEQLGSPAFTPAFWRKLLDSSAVPPPGQLREKHRAAKRWLRNAEVDRLLIDRAWQGPRDRVVFGHGDPNVDNLVLHHGTARLVDFEDAGRSRPVFELANLIEHLANHCCGFEALTQRFDVSARELLLCRRLIAIYWFTRLNSHPATRERNPAGLINRQAERLRTLLDTRT